MQLVMCGRYSITTPAEAVQRLFRFEGARPNLPARYNVAPTQAAPVIRSDGGARRLAQLRWGLVPSWSKEIGVKPLINARSETAAEKPSFRAALRQRRCLVPADGFYEWATLGEFEKQPFRFHRPENALFAFAGLWESWQGPSGAIESFAILSAAANTQMAPIHDRSPVVIADADHEDWLNPQTPFGRVEQLLAPPPEDLFVFYPISRAVNRVSEDGPALWEPAAPERLAPKAKPEKKPAKPPSGQFDLF